MKKDAHALNWNDKNILPNSKHSTHACTRKEINHFVSCKRSLSTVIASLLIVLLTITLVVIVWAVMTNLVNKQLEGASCVDLVGKVKLGDFTCYYSDNSNNKFLLVQINRENVDVKRFSVSLSSAGITKSFDIYEGKKVYEGDTRLDEPSNWVKDDVIIAPKANLSFPGENEARVYMFDIDNITEMRGEKPDVINLYPYSKDKKCSSMSTMIDIPACSS